MIRRAKRRRDRFRHLGMAAILLSALLYSGCRKPTQPVTVTFLDAEGQGVPGDHPLISGVLQEFTQETGIRVNDLPTPEDNGSKLELAMDLLRSGAITNASTCLRRLDREPPDLEGARAGAALIIRDANRAAEIINRVRLFFRKGVMTKERVDVNEMIREMEILLHNEATQHAVFVETKLAAAHPLIVADRIQLQQVLMNLMINGIDAMKAVDGPRQLTLGTQNDSNEQLLVSVQDTGIGLPPNQAGQIFNAFFTTKEHGTGMGLRISRTIIEAHGGRLWATDNHPRGASFHFTLAVSSDAASLDARSNG